MSHFDNFDFSQYSEYSEYSEYAGVVDRGQTGFTVISSKLSTSEISTLIQWTENLYKNAQGGLYSDPNLIIVECITYMEKFKNLTGAERKDITIQICSQVLNRVSGLDASGTLSTTIDLLVDLTKGKYDINKIQKVATGCLGLFSSSRNRSY